MVLSNSTLAGRHQRAATGTAGRSSGGASTRSPARWSYFYVTLAVFALLAIAVANLRRGRTGRRLLAVRSNERAAAAMGISVTGMKLYAFAVAGCIAAAGGVLLAFSQPIPQFTGYDPMTSLTNLIGAVLGGIGYVLGPVFGGLFASSGLPDSILSPVDKPVDMVERDLPAVYRHRADRPARRQPQRRGRRLAAEPGKGSGGAAACPPERGTRPRLRAAASAARPGAGRHGPAGDVRLGTSPWTG